MANRNFSNAGKIYNFHVMPVLLDCNFVVGSSGSVNSLKGPGIASVIRLAPGIYQIKLQDNYNRYYGGFAGLVAPAIGSNVADGSLVVGTPYMITAVGTTNWHAAGLPAEVTPAVNVAFVATSIGGAGSGTAKAVGASGISSVEVIGDSNLSISPDPAISPGGIILVQCMGPTSAGVTTQIAKDPATGSVLSLAIYLSNSSIMIAGE